MATKLLKFTRSVYNNNTISLPQGWVEQNNVTSVNVFILDDGALRVEKNEEAST